MKVAPVLTARADGWHVDAALPGVTRFTFVVRIADSADAYADDVASPFTIDPLRFGGRPVSVSARASGRKTNPWATAVKVDVPSAKPVMTVQPDRVHVDAYLTGTKSFTFVVKATGLPDTHVADVAPPFVIDQAKFGGRSVSVSAQAGGSRSYPWAPEQTIDVPQLKLFGISNPTGPKGAPAGDAKELGVTLVRIELTYGEDIATTDAKIAANFPQLPVWITEIGYRLHEMIDGVAVTEGTQAELMQRSLVDYMTWPWAQAYVWFTWFDYDDLKTGDPNWYGIVELDGSHRPAYDTYRHFIATNTSESPPPSRGAGGG